MSILALVSLVLILSYLIYSAVKAKEIPDSVSDTAYIGDSKVFTAALGGTAALLSPTLLEVAPEGFKWAAFTTIMGLFMAALTPEYKTKDSIIHYTGGISAGISSQLLVALNNPSLLYTWSIFPVLWIINKKNSVFWAEMICLITTSMTILMK